MFMLGSSHRLNDVAVPSLFSAIVKLIGQGSEGSDVCQRLVVGHRLEGESIYGGDICHPRQTVTVEFS